MANDFYHFGRAEALLLSALGYTSTPSDRSLLHAIGIGLQPSAEMMAYVEQLPQPWLDEVRDALSKMTHPVRFGGGHRTPDSYHCGRRDGRSRGVELRNRVLLGEAIKAARLERNVDIDWLATRSGMKAEAIEAIEAALYPATVDVINRLLRIMSASEPRALGLTPKAIGPRRKKPGF